MWTVLSCCSGCPGRGHRSVSTRGCSGIWGPSETQAWGSAAVSETSCQGRILLISYWL